MKTITKRELINMLEQSQAPDNAILNVSLDQEDIIPVQRVALSTLPEDAPAMATEFCLDFKTAESKTESAICPFCEHEFICEPIDGSTQCPSCKEYFNL